MEGSLLEFSIRAVVKHKVGGRQMLVSDTRKNESDGSLKRD